MKDYEFDTSGYVKLSNLALKKDMKHNKVLVSNRFYQAERVYLEKDEETPYTLKEGTRTFILEKGLVDLEVNEKRILMQEGIDYTVHPRQEYRLIAYKDSEVLAVSTPDLKVDSWTDFSQPRNPKAPTKYTIDTDPERFTDHPWVDYDSY